MDDNELMARLALGDTDALEKLIARHRAWAEAMACRLLHDPVEAQDVAQEAFARVYLLRQRYRPDFTFRTYLGVLVRSLCLDRLRRARRTPVPSDVLPEAPVPSAEGEALHREERMRLWDAIAALDERDRALLEGFALAGMSYRELAQRRGMTTAQVKLRLHRIRRRLRAMKEEDEP